MPEQLSRERRERIAGRLSVGQPVVAATLAAEFAVSEDAIRRDLRALAEAGLCRRVYGGALPLSPAVLPMAARLQEAPERKRALAQAALGTLEPGEFVFLDASSANVELARRLPLDAGLTLATNAVDVAAVLLQRAASRLLLVGGAVDPVIGGCVDGQASAAVARMNIDRCFVGVCALDAQAGLSVVDHADALFKRAVLAASRQRLALVMADKLAARAPHRVAAVSEFDLLIVEHASPAPALDALVQAGARIRRAPAAA